MGIAACLVIFPDQLVGAVIDIAGSVRTVTYRENIAVVVVFITIGHTVDIRNLTELRDLSGCVVANSGEGVVGCQQ